MSGALLKVRVNPRSSRNQITGWRSGVLQVKLTAPPVEGAANAACIRFLADSLGLKKAQMTLISGHSSREKAIEIEGLSQADLDQRINSLAGDS
jgi:uncharacterized protein